MSEDGNYVVAVTDDKAVYVFENNEGQLTEVSRRSMPKRPCAVQILPDSTAVLIADKFGDVYSLPLIPSEDEEEAAAAQESTPQPEVAWKPSANNLTVHSQRNLKVLEAQAKQKNFTPRKEPLKFKHELLLGHVSMLTDMKYITQLEGEKQRAHIITADRDEHIRISRGPPQAHIIEGYCLGHTEFVSKICQVGDTNLLVSGGGDGWLGVWDWRQHKLVKKIDILQHVRETPGYEKEDQIVVSGIWSTAMDVVSGMETQEVIVVACEKVKALYLLPMSYPRAGSSALAALGPDETLVVKVFLEGCPLDFVGIGESAVVSIDVREEGKRGFRLRTFRLKSNGQLGDSASQVGFGEQDDYDLQALNQHSGPEKDVTSKDMDSLLYGLADMRKRRDVQDGGENGEGNQADQQE